jgi:hypothetical protein
VIVLLKACFDVRRVYTDQMDPAADTLDIFDDGSSQVGNLMFNCALLLTLFVLDCCKYSFGEYESNCAAIQHRTATNRVCFERISV